MLNTGNCEPGFDDIKPKNEELMDERLLSTAHRDSPSSNPIVVKSESFESSDHGYSSDQLKINQTDFEDGSSMNGSLNTRESISHSKELSSLIEESSRSSLFRSSSASSSSNSSSSSSSVSSSSKQNLNQNTSPVNTVNSVSERIIFDSTCNETRTEAKINSTHFNNVLIDHVSHEKPNNGSKMDELSNSSGNSNHKSIAVSNTTTNERGDTQEGNKKIF